MSKRKTHDEFVKELNNINKNIKVIGKYTNNKSKIKCKCKICKYEWNVIPDSLLRGTGCPNCAGKIKNTRKFINDMQKINPNIKVLGEYKRWDIKVQCFCLLHNKYFESTPYSLLKNHTGCYDCKISKMATKRTKSKENFLEDLKKVNTNVEIIGEYKSAKEKILCKCIIDGYVWEITPDNLLRGEGCPKCSTSKGEKRCIEYFKNNKIQYISQYEYDDLFGVGNRHLKFDFAIVDNSQKVLGLVEYDGVFHYRKIYDNDKHEILKDHDKRKDDYCLKNNIQLLRIPYWEYNNIESILEKYIENIKEKINGFKN